MCNGRRFEVTNDAVVEEWFRTCKRETYSFVAYAALTVALYCRLVDTIGKERKLKQKSFSCIRRSDQTAYVIFLRYCDMFSPHRLKPMLPLFANGLPLLIPPRLLSFWAQGRH